MVLTPTDRQCRKAISRIHNATDEVAQYGSVANGIDAEQTAAYLLWDVWANSLCEREKPELGEPIEQQRSPYAGGRRWIYEILYSEKRLTIETNQEGVLIGSWVR